MTAKKTEPQQQPQQADTPVAKNQPGATKHRLDTARLNKAAADILEQIPDHAGELVHNLTRQHRLELWQYTAGILLAVHQEGRLSEFRMDPAWRDGLKTKQLICQYCNKSFTPRHVGQPYCSNECGLRADGKLTDLPKENKDADDDVDSQRTLGRGSADSTNGWSEVVEDSRPATKAKAKSA